MKYDSLATGRHLHFFTDNQKIMSSIVSGICKATLGLLVNKVRDKTAEKLKHSDVLDQTFRDLIVRELDDIKTKLDGLARTNLLASIEFFKTGIANLNHVFEKPLIDISCEEAAAIAAKSSQEVDVTDTSAKVASLVAERVEDLRVTDLNESARQAFADASKRFEAARLEATRAFSNEALKTSDRILALKIQLMATILERLDSGPSSVLDDCRICLKNLHSMQAVRENFKVHLTGGLKSWMNTKKRESIIVAVCQVNHVVFRVMEVINGGKVDSIRLPCIKIGVESVDLLCDQRITETLVNLGMGDVCRGLWSFGENGTSREVNLECALHVVTNTRGQFVIADMADDQVKVYSCGGMFLYSLRPSVDQCLAVATDRNDTVYALGNMSVDNSTWVHVFDQHGEQLRKFSLSDEFRGFLITVNDNNQIFVIGIQTDGSYHVEVFDAEGKFIRSFGKESLKCPRDITSANDGLVLVLDTAHPACVKTFSAHGDVQQQFMLPDDIDSMFGSIAYNVDNTVIVSVWESKITEKLLIYTRDGRLVHDVKQLDGDTTLRGIKAVAVTADGRIAVIKQFRKIFVMQKEDYVL